MYTCCGEQQGARARGTGRPAGTGCGWGGQVELGSRMASGDRALSLFKEPMVLLWEWWAGTEQLCTMLWSHLPDKEPCQVQCRLLWAWVATGAGWRWWRLGPEPLVEVVQGCLHPLDPLGELDALRCQERRRQRCCQGFVLDQWEGLSLASTGKSYEEGFKERTKA